jgi:hypothetical protein
VSSGEFGSIAIFFSMIVSYHSIFVSMVNEPHKIESLESKFESKSESLKVHYTI